MRICPNTRLQTSGKCYSIPPQCLNRMRRSALCEHVWQLRSPPTVSWPCPDPPLEEVSLGALTLSDTWLVCHVQNNEHFLVLEAFLWQPIFISNCVTYYVLQCIWQAWPPVSIWLWTNWEECGALFQLCCQTHLWWQPLLGWYEILQKFKYTVLLLLPPPLPQFLQTSRC